MANPKRTALAAKLVLAIATVAVFVDSAEAKSNEFSARIVLFIPEDAEPPEGYERRLGSLAKRAESFFAKWMKHWKRDIERETIFARNEDDAIQVTLVKGTLKNAVGRAALPEARRLARDGAMAKLGLSANDEVVWWIFYDYPQIRGFQGGGNTTGGTAINAYPPGTGEISQELDLASPELAETAIKGTIHEFGHALGLPHIGPRPGRKLGNSLMGPINRVYWSKTQAEDTRVYLSEASAAILWKHPIFRAEEKPSPKIPQRVDVSDLSATEQNGGEGITVRGTLRSDQSAHSAVLFDSARGRFGDYWTRAYVGAVDEQGRFSVQVEAPFERGTLFLSFCFENGVSSADGKRPLLRGSVVEIPYRGQAGTPTFELPD